MDPSEVHLQGPSGEQRPWETANRDLPNRIEGHLPTTHSGHFIPLYKNKQAMKSQWTPEEDQKWDRSQAEQAGETVFPLYLLRNERHCLSEAVQEAYDEVRANKYQERAPGNEKPVTEGSYSLETLRKHINIGEDQILI